MAVEMLCLRHGPRHHYLATWVDGGHDFGTRDNTKKKKPRVATQVANRMHYLVMYECSYLKIVTLVQVISCKLPKVGIYE